MATSMVKQTPQFIHDCPNCEFIGTQLNQDLYKCLNGTTMACVIRYSNIPEEFESREIHITDKDYLSFGRWESFNEHIKQWKEKVK